MLFTKFAAGLLAFMGAAMAQYNTDNIDRDLGSKLSKGASIVHSSSAAPRWSDYYAPNPGTVVNVAEEKDVQATVQYCLKHGINFLTQTGGHGWAKTFHIGQHDLVINTRGMNKISFSSKKDSITFGSGALISEVVEAAYGQGLQVPTGNCDCVGTIGAILGGGLGRLMGRYGLGSDNLLSVNLVTAAGDLLHVTPTSPSPDLWWALRGAGPNFGVVTSVTMRAYPAVNNGNAWIGILAYKNEQLEDVIKTVNSLTLEKEMSIHVYFLVSQETGELSVSLEPWYSGTEEDAKRAFKPLFDLNPVANTAKVTPYNKVNSGAAGFCTKGGRKPGYTVGMRNLDPKSFRQVFEELKAFIAETNSPYSGMVIECYSTQKMRSLPDSASAYPHRDVRFHAIPLPWYNDASLDQKANAFGQKAVSILRATDGFGRDHAYINFANGNEDLSTIYGNSLGRLRQLKKKWDPKGVFSQWFSLS